MDVFNSDKCNKYCFYKKNVFIRVRICVYCDRVVCIVMVNGIVMVSVIVNGFVSDIRMSIYCVSLVLRVL